MTMSARLWVLGLHLSTAPHPCSGLSGMALTRRIFKVKKESLEINSRESCNTLQAFSGGGAGI